MSIQLHTSFVFGHKSAIFWPIGLKLFMVTQKTINIIYRLVIKNHSLGPYNCHCQFLGRKKGVAHIAQIPTWVWDLKPNQKITHLVELMGHLLSRNCVPNFFDLGPPLICRILPYPRARFFIFNIGFGNQFGLARSLNFSLPSTVRVDNFFNILS